MKKLFWSSKIYLFIFLCFYFILFNVGCKKECSIDCDRGSQENCVCVCPDGWEGARCQTEIIPSQIFIKSVNVTKMPDKKSDGNTWDIASGEQNPDLMLRIWRDNNPPNEDWVVGISESSFGGTKMNSNPSGTHTFTYTGTGGSLSFPTRKYRISLYDDDGASGYNENEDDFISGFTFTPYQNGLKFPNPIKLSNSQVEFEINVEYKWD